MTATTQNITITPVNLSTSVLTFSVHCIPSGAGCNQPDDTQVTGQLTATDTIRFRRFDNDDPLLIQWSVVEFEPTSGVVVQRGTVPILFSNMATVNLTTAVNLARSFPLITAASSFFDTNFNSNDWVRARLTSSTTLELSTTTLFSLKWVDWQVIEYPDATVQSGDLTLSSTTASQTVSITAVDTSKAWLIYTYNSSGGSVANIGEDLIRGTVTNATTLTFDRDQTGSTLNLTWYLVEFTDGTTVQQGNAHFNPADTQVDVTLKPINPAYSIALGGYMGRGGKSPYTGDDNIGVGWFSLDLTSSTNLRLTRGSTAGGTASADVGWSVIQFLPTPTRAELVYAVARGGPDGVLLEWRTAQEQDNLGFHVYRESATGLEQLTSSPIPGSAFITGPRMRLHTGRAYRFWDPDGRQGVRYWIEDIDLNGRTRWHGPLVVAWNAQPVASSKTPPWRPHRAKKKKHRRMRHRPTRRNGVPPWFTAVDEEARDTNLTFSPRRLRTQWQLAARHALKIPIRSEGWYRLTGAQLLAAGFKRNTDPRRLQLYVEGRQVPLWVKDNHNHRLDPNDAVAFYGIGLDLIESDARIYWLVKGKGRLSRLRRRRARPAGPRMDAFLLSTEVRPRTLYFPALKNGPAPNFFGPPVWSSPTTLDVNVHHIASQPQSDAILEVTLQGVTDLANESPDHVVRVAWNGQDLGLIQFDGTNQATHRFLIPHAWLQPGANTVQFQSQAAFTDVSLVVAVRLTYWHKYVAENGTWLRFGVPWGYQAVVEGFRSPDIWVLDVTNPDRPRQIKGRVRPAPDGTYRLQVSGSGHIQSVMVAFTRDAIRTPKDLIPNRPSSWHQRKYRADAVVITHAAFADAARSYSRLRRRRGWKIRVIDVDDLYDEFTYGVHHATALKMWLRRATRVWRRAPRFLVLFGDASVDPRNFLGFGSFDFVPTQTVVTQYLETASDDALGDFNGDGIPEVTVGRFPVRTRAEAALIISKLKESEEPPEKPTALLVADRTDREYPFAKMSEQLRAQFPPTFNLHRVYLDSYPSVAAARTALFQKWQSGVDWVQFIGHGSVEIWSPQELLKRSDMPYLAELDRLPIVVGLTCLNAYFHNTYTETLSEALLLSRGGALAVWSSSALTEPGPQMVLARSFYQHIFKGHAHVLGDAIAAAKAATQDLDVRRSWILLGDPLLPLR